MGRINMLHLKKTATIGLTLAMVVSVIPMTSLAAHYEEWVKKDGKWYYYDEYGKKVKETWKLDPADGKIYVLDSKGVRVTKKGWFEAKNFYTDYGQKVSYSTKYYIKKGGEVTTGWKKIGKKYYYFDQSGRMMTSGSFVKGSKLYLLGDDGARITKKGWHQVTVRHIESNGVKTSAKYWYYVTKDKVVQTGIKTIKGKKYYFNDNGVMQTNAYYKTKKGQIYIFGKDGARITKKGWNKITIKYTVKHNIDDTYLLSSTGWFYIKKDGTATTGWKKISGKWYYFETNTGVMCVSMSYEIDGVIYLFNKDGVCVNK